MSEPSPRKTSPSAKKTRLVAQVILGAFVLGTVLFVTQRVMEQSGRIAMQVTTPKGHLRLAEAKSTPRSVDWICSADDPAVHVLKAGELLPADWDTAVAALIPKAKIERILKTTHTMQASAGDDSAPQVQVVRARLDLYFEATDTIEPALGISASVKRGRDAESTHYITVVRLLDREGNPQPIDGHPLFNQDPIGWVDRARGMPAHLVQLPIEIQDPEDEFLPPDDPVDDLRAREAIEQLRRNRPERGVLPNAPRKE